MTSGPWLPEGLKGARSFRGTIMGFVAAGRSLASAMAFVEAQYAAAGRALQANTRAAVERMYAVESELQTNARSLSHVPGNIAIGNQWISYATLERNINAFAENPRYAVRFRVRASILGEPFEQWQTRYYYGLGVLPPTVGALRSSLLEGITLTNYEPLMEAPSYSVDQIAISAL